MKNKTLVVLWAMLYALCTLLGFIPSPTGFLRFLLSLFAAVFFVPAFMLLHDALTRKNRKLLRFLRLVSALSLGLTLVLLVANFLGVMASQAVGNLLYVLLVLVSTPMVCSGYWVASLFLWACLLMATFLKPKKCVIPY